MEKEDKWNLITSSQVQSVVDRRESTSLRRSIKTIFLRFPSWPAHCLREEIFASQEQVALSWPKSESTTDGPTEGPTNRQTDGPTGGQALL